MSRRICTTFKIIIVVEAKIKIRSTISRWNLILFASSIPNPTRQRGKNKERIFILTRSMPRFRAAHNRVYIGSIGRGARPRVEINGHY